MAKAGSFRTDVGFLREPDIHSRRAGGRAGRIRIRIGLKDLVGASPDAPADFVTKLLAKDEGWLAVYYDVLSRVSKTQQAYFAEPHRLPRFYEALRGQDISPSPSRPVFRPNPGLLLLATRINIEANGQPHIPGGVDVWKDIVAAHHKDDSKITKDWLKRADHWNNPDQVVEGMFGLSRVNADGQTRWQFFWRSAKSTAAEPADQRLSPQTVRLLADKFFALQPAVSDALGVPGVEQRVAGQVRRGCRGGG